MYCCPGWHANSEFSLVYGREGGVWVGERCQEGGGAALSQSSERGQAWMCWEVL